MTERTRFTAYVTDRALTEGVKMVEVEDCFHLSADMVYPVKNRHHGCILLPDWHRTREEAIARAEAMRLAKIEAMREQVAKLEALRFV